MWWCSLLVRVRVKTRRLGTWLGRHPATRGKGAFLEEGEFFDKPAGDRAGIPGFAWLIAKNKPKKKFALTREKQKTKNKKSTKTPPQKHKNTKKHTQKTPNLFFSRLRAKLPPSRQKKTNSHSNQNGMKPKKIPLWFHAKKVGLPCICVWRSALGMTHPPSPPLLTSTVRPWARGFCPHVQPPRCPHGRPGRLGFGLCGRLPRHGAGGFVFNSPSPPLPSAHLPARTEALGPRPRHSEARSQENGRLVYFGAGGA